MQLAFVVGVTQTELIQAMQAGSLTFAYVVSVLAFARPFMRRWLVPSDDSQPSVGSHGTSSHATSSHAAGVLIALLLSAFITEAIGIRATFGAFLLGAVVPHDS